MTNEDEKRPPLTLTAIECTNLLALLERVPWQGTAEARVIVNLSNTIAAIRASVSAS